MKIKTLIVDDEPLAREKLQGLLIQDREIEIIGECTNGREALSAIQALRPDLVFLDVQMPELDGFGVLARLDVNTLPTIVFVTAYDQYAIKAFEVSALDYLLKPFDRERFQRALERAKKYLKSSPSGDVSAHLIALLENLKNKNYLERLVIKSGGRIFFIKTEEIDHIEAAGKYVRVFWGSESHLLRETMSALEAQLNPKIFLRIHRSTIVNLDRIKELQPWFNGDYVAILKDGTRLTVSRSYREKLHQQLGKSF
jgi:two-component system LytT family response regulator